MLRLGRLIPQAFYLRPVDTVARELLGQFLVCEAIVLRITEVEAYGGPEDSASHCRFGRTARNAPMWGAGGHVYRYLCYGLHQMLNVVTGAEGQGAAVLIRACSPIAGLAEIQARRGATQLQRLLDGPGKVGQALALDAKLDGQPLFRKGGLELRFGNSATEFRVSPRIGIGFAQPEDRLALRRYWLEHPAPERPPQHRASKA